MNDNINNNLKNSLNNNMTISLNKNIYNNTNNNFMDNNINNNMNLNINNYMSLSNNMNNILNNNKNNNMKNNINNNKTNKDVKIKFIFEEILDCDLKFLEFNKLTMNCSGDNLVSDILSEFIIKTNNLDIDFVFKKGYNKEKLNRGKKVSEELYNPKNKQYLDIYVYYPEVGFKKLNEKNYKISQWLKKIDNEIDNKIYTIEFILYPDTKKGLMIYICDKKTEFLTFLNKRILDLPYVGEELISKLFDKNDKISKIIKYFKEHSYH
jgi:hypothetical protein